MQITPHFDSKEYDCHDGTPYPPAWVDSKLRPLCTAMERVRAEFGGAKIAITSGYRTASYNKHIGGAADSQHVHGDANDFKVEGVDARAVYAVMEKLIEKRAIPDGGLGSYKSWVHYDQRGHKARWKE